MPEVTEFNRRHLFQTPPPPALLQQEINLAMGIGTVSQLEVKPWLLDDEVIYEGVLARGSLRFTLRYRTVRHTLRFDIHGLPRGMTTEQHPMARVISQLVTHH